MRISVQFLGGPLDRMDATINKLKAAQIFFDERDRRVLVYIREDEILYVYDHDKSKEATERYDEFKAKFEDKEPQSLEFIEPEEKSVYDEEDDGEPESETGEDDVT